MQSNTFSTYPQTGWGQVLSLFTAKDVIVKNLAKNGRSTKSFLSEGRFEEIEKQIQKGDLLIVGFGHNDEKKEDPNRYTEARGSFQKNLRYFAEIAMKKEADVLFTTPVIRRKFVGDKIENTHGDYSDAIVSVATNLGVVYADIHQRSKTFFESIGAETSKRYFMHFPPKQYELYPQGSNDDSHLRYEGAVLIAKFVVQEIVSCHAKIANFFEPLPAEVYSNKASIEK